MNKAGSIVTIFVIVLITFSLTGCGLSLAKSTPTPLPTTTNTATIKPTNTVKPTATITLTPTMWHLPTNTINATGTAQYNDMADYVSGLIEEGYVPSAKGVYARIEDYSNQWAQLNWYQWHDTGWRVEDFVLRAHMAWSSDHETPNPSGCGVVFRIQNSEEHYVVFLLSLGYVDFAITTDQVNEQPWVYWGPSQNEGEADFSLVAVGSKYDVFVNDKHIKSFTGYQGKWTEGGLGFTTLSGTNAGYGTECDITNADLWMLK